MKTKTIDLFQPAALPELLLQLAEQLKQQTIPAGRHQAAIDIIKEYFHCYHIPEVRQFLWQMLAGSFSSGKMEQLKKSSQRHELIFFYEFTLMLIDAAFVLKEK